MNEVHRFGSKDSGSQNISFLAFKGEVVGVTQISSCNDNGADRRKIFYRSNQKLFSHKKSWKVKLSDFFFNFSRR
jgi:hypothetical protein